ncbi:MAG: nitrilase-related carbon-nitrogen hydrolase [Thiohalocapsa sp.]
MQTIRVTAAALNQTPLDWSGNCDRIRRAIAGARESCVSILCLPELCLTGYGCEDAFLSAGLRSRAIDMLEELLPETKGMLVTFGLPLLYQNALYHTVALAGDGKLLGVVAKRYLAGDGIHYEPRWFKPWPAGLQKSIHLGGREVPLGDLDFDVDGVRIGFEICEDAWVAQRPGAAAALRGADIILNPSASHFAFGKCDVRERFVLEGSRAYNVSYVYSNLVGNESGRAIYDGEMLIASAGHLLKRGPRFSFRDIMLTTADIDLDHTRTSQVRTHSYQPQMDEDLPDPVRASFPW